MGRAPAEFPASIEDQAADCVALLQHLGIERAHVVGHSLGGCIAVQMARDSPEAVRSLVLVEPALAIGSTANGYRESLAQGRERFRDGDPADVVDALMEARWPGYREPLERLLPGAFAGAVEDAAVAFDEGVPALLAWQFAEEDARRIHQPVLCVLGGDSNALWSRFGEVHRLLLAWLPQAEEFVLPGTTRFLQVEKPGEFAEALAGFLARQGGR